jgi:hypothetical protein
LSAGWSPEKIERQFKIKIPPHLLGEGETNENEEEEPDLNVDKLSMVEGQEDPFAQFVVHG